MDGLPFRFEKSGAQYIAHGPNYLLTLAADENRLAWSDPQGGQTAHIRTRFLHARHGTRLEAMDALPGSVNYLVGKPLSWRTGVKGYGNIRYREIYPGIDLVFHGRQGCLEYDFILQPGANPAAIRMDLSGQDDAYVDANGDLVVMTRAGQIRWKRPQVYQESGGRRIPVAGQFTLTAKRIAAFTLGEYDRNLTLVIDPALSYLTYLGGAKNDVARAIAVDTSGNAYVAGISNSVDLPVLSAYQTSLRVRPRTLSPEMPSSPSSIPPVPWSISPIWAAAWMMGLLPLPSIQVGVPTSLALPLRATSLPSIPISKPLEDWAAADMPASATPSSPN